MKCGLWSPKHEDWGKKLSRISCTTTEGSRYNKQWVEGNSLDEMVFMEAFHRPSVLNIYSST